MEGLESLDDFLGGKSTALALLRALRKLPREARQRIIAKMPPDQRADLTRLSRALAAKRHERLDPISWAVPTLGIARHSLIWMEPGQATYDAYVKSGRQQPPTDPDEYVRRYVAGDIGPGWGGWDGTPNGIALMCWALARGHNVAVEAATGVSKTHTAAWLPLWFIATQPRDWGCIVNAFSTDLRSLRKKLWAENGRHFKAGFRDRYPKAFRSRSKQDLELLMDPESEDARRWGFFAYAPEVSADEESNVGAQGEHALFMLTLFDEMAGIANSILTAAQQTSVGYFNPMLGIGNPDHEQDTLHKFAMLEDTIHIRLSALDYPNVVANNPLVIPGGVDLKSIDKRIRNEFGGDPSSPLAMSRIRGFCPSVNDDCLFTVHAINDARDHLVDGADLRDEKEGRDNVSVGNIQEHGWGTIVGHGVDATIKKNPEHTAENRVVLLPRYQKKRTRSGRVRLQRVEDLAVPALTLHSDHIRTEYRADGSPYPVLAECEGRTVIYGPPEPGWVGHVSSYLDVAGSKKQGDAHAALFFDHIARWPLALVWMRGDAKAYVLECLRVAKMLGVPWHENSQIVLPHLTHERNGVGANLHNTTPELLEYPELVRAPSSSRPDAAPSSVPGYTMDEKKRDDGVELVRAWGYELRRHPERVRSAPLWLQMKGFVRKKSKRDQTKHRYEAAAGFHDDIVMSLAGNLLLRADKRIMAEPFTTSPAAHEERLLGDRAAAVISQAEAGALQSAMDVAYGHADPFA